MRGIGMSLQEEFTAKLGKIRAFLNTAGYDAALFTRNDSFSWLSCGHYAFVDKSLESAAAVLAVTGKDAFVFCNSSEMYRIPAEELQGLPFTLIDYPWNADGGAVIKERLKGMKAVSDSGFLGTEYRAGLIELRYVHTPEEIARYREIGPGAAKIAEDCLGAVRPGGTEYELAGEVTGALMAAGFQVPVCLAASDERILKYRHPLPTPKKIADTVLLAVCARKYGLTVSMTRMLSFKKPDREITKKFEAVLRVDAAYIRATVPGTKAGDVVRAGKAVYEETGFGEDFYLHHQGGALGYAARYYCAAETDQNVIMNNQAFSWNPTIAGVKSEDTYLVIEGTQEIISQSGSWPQLQVETRGGSVRRPDILIL
jgi:Xaa-Pro aminopeptidase